MSGITYDEILAELGRLGVTDDEAPGGFSTREWAAEWGCGIAKARGLIRRGMMEGKFTASDVVIGNVMRPGHRVRSTIYRWNGVGE